MCWELSWEREEGRALVAGQQHVRGPEEGQEKDSEPRVRDSGEKMKAMG